MMWNDLRARRFFFDMVLLILLGHAWVTPVQAADGDIDYLRQIKPIFAKRCYSCHGALQQKSGLRLDTAALVRKGGTQGAAVEPGKPDDSLLIEAITGQGGTAKMPPEGDGTPLSPEELDLVKRWISQGANGPADEPQQVNPREYWSYQIPVKAPVPVVKNPAWVLNPIDTFIAFEQEKRGLTPRPPADKATWLRRVYLDLIGVPPSRDEFQAFLRDDSPLAEEKVVDELLERPQYGERWGRHWMDVWRYSDWYGSRAINEIRYSQRHIWRWRDWIIESLNQDHGYDQMVVEMLAGDELAPTNPDVLRATGFLGRNWYKFDRNVWMFDTVEHSSQAFLGLTLKCCRCHDHKYDPISQADYYHFRAFFEPHDVRTDRISEEAATEKDATGGPVLKEGVARVYDKTPDVKTYLFQRGDNRLPDEKNVMEPAVPVALAAPWALSPPPGSGSPAITIQSVSLPVEAYYPTLQPLIADGLVATARTKVLNAAQHDAKAQAALLAAQTKIELFSKQPLPPKPDAAAETNQAAVVFQDDFSKARPDIWRTVSGEWQYENGHLTQKSIGGFLTLASTLKLPQDFHAKLRYKTLEAGSLRSVGFSFDRLDADNSQDVYTHVNAGSQGIQAFHRTAGNQIYPANGIVKTQDIIHVGDLITVEIVAQGQNLTLILNGQRQLEYVMPIARRTGTFALWCHLGSAEFHELQIRELAPTLEDLQHALRTSMNSLALHEQKRLIAEAELASVQARLNAERAKFSNQPDTEKIKALALIASRSERTVAWRLAEETALLAGQQLAMIKASSAAVPGLPASDAAAAPGQTQPAATPTVNSNAAQIEAEKKLEMAKQALATAQLAVENPDGKYAALGEQFPATSTGRRLALARWITQPKNPRTARVAVNHIWLRHFGQGLVPSVSNFGLNGDVPTHPQLLDWLAVELMENGWRMKPIHRMLVLSNTYRLSSSNGPADNANLVLDPHNKYLWKTNSRRMEAEAVRDSVLSVAGSLDLRQGGPEIPEAEGLISLRRSLYFRATPNEKMKFLEVFDAADPNGCYRRQQSVVPHQALALMNSSLALDQARLLAEKLSKSIGEKNDDVTNIAFIQAAFEQILTHVPSAEETAACQKFLAGSTLLVQDMKQTPFPAGGQSKRPPATQPHLRARENLVLVLLSHNAFVTIR
jgi:mono/diheme cytochrome c family protein